MMYQNKYEVLGEVFGHSSFRPGQEDAVDALLAGRDVLAILPTGGGKSVCYQIPALLLPGVTVVVSPLISLMKDQVGALIQNGVRAAYLNSTLTPGQYGKALANLKNGVYKIVYAAPERLTTDGFLEAVSALDISMVAVDEAHCVSGWGQDFRPAYLGIRDFLALLPRRPVVGAFTATATERVSEDIVDLLGLNDPLRIQTGFDRPNLFFEVIPVTRGEKKDALLKLMRSRYADKCGIVYCSTRAAVEEVTELLVRNGISVRGYHAGMEDAERHAAQEDFIFDRCRVMAATNAFGMGIDKPDVGFVIHYNMPKDVESYYQEAGRAGRDGSAADCVLLCSKSDIVLNRYLIEQSEPNPELTAEEVAAVRRMELDRLDRMADYCSAPGCLRAYLLGYFGQSAPENCGNCSNCTGDVLRTDVTEDARKILSCMARTECRYGISTIAAVLLGEPNPTAERGGLESLSTWGIMKEKNAAYIRGIFSALRSDGAVAFDPGSVYRIPVMTEKGRDILFGRRKLFIKTEPKTKKEAAKEKSAAARKRAENGETNPSLLARLKEERLRLAREAVVPAYVIFTDAALEDMCRLMPKTEKEFLEVNGVGKVKAEKYGARFLSVIASYLEG